MKRLATYAVCAAIACGIGAGAANAAPATGHVPRGQCEWMILSVPPLGAMPRILASGLNYGQAIAELRLFQAEGIRVRLRAECSL